MKHFSAAYHLACVTLVASEGSLRGNLNTAKNLKTLMERKLPVIGPDNRVKANFVGKPPFTAVGLVATNTGSCTGVMVGPDLMLTAQTCGYNKTSTEPIIFAPAYHEDQVPFTPARSEDFFFDHEVNIAAGASVTDIDTAFNWVIVKLDREIGNEVGFWETLVYDKQWDGTPRWFHIGYTSELDDGQKIISAVFTNTTNTVYSADSLFSNGAESYMMKTDVDTGPGQAGGT